MKDDTYKGRLIGHTFGLLLTCVCPLHRPSRLFHPLQSIAQVASILKKDEVCQFSIQMSWTAIIWVHSSQHSLQLLCRLNLVYRLVLLTTTWKISFFPTYVPSILSVQYLRGKCFLNEGLTDASFANTTNVWAYCQECFLTS